MDFAVRQVLVVTGAPDDLEYDQGGPLRPSQQEARAAYCPMARHHATTAGSYWHFVMCWAIATGAKMATEPRSHY